MMRQVLLDHGLHLHERGLIALPAARGIQVRSAFYASKRRQLFCPRDDFGIFCVDSRCGCNRDRP